MLTTARTSDPSRGDLRRLAALIGALFLLESALFSAVTPLLPYYAHRLALSQTDVGVLAGAYSIGMLAGAPFARWSGARAGIRRTILRGLSMLGLATMAFALGTDIVALDLARVVQGFASGCVLTASFSWLIGATSDQRRERLLGGAMGAAVFGTLLGPAIGTIAVTVGVQPVFGVVLGCIVALFAWMSRMPGPVASQPLRPLRSLRPRRPLAAAVGLVALPGIIYGALGAVMPLHLTYLGARGAGVGATFLCAAALASFLAPVSGRMASRRGSLATLRMELLVVACLLLALVVLSGLAASVAVAAILVASSTTLWVPSMALLTRVVEAAGIDAGVSAVLINVSIAMGEGLGSLLGASVAESISYDVTFAALATLALLTWSRLGEGASNRLGLTPATGAQQRP